MRPVDSPVFCILVSSLMDHMSGTASSVPRLSPLFTLRSLGGRVRHRPVGALQLELHPFMANIYFCFLDYAKAFDSVDHNKLWKILKEMGIPDHLTCLLRNLYARQEATVRTGHGTTDWFHVQF